MGYILPQMGYVEYRHEGDRAGPFLLQKFHLQKTHYSKIGLNFSAGPRSVSKIQAKIGDFYFRNPSQTPQKKFSLPILMKSTGPSEKFRNLTGLL